MFQSRARRERLEFVRNAALHDRDNAAEAFLRLDEEQTQIATLVTAYTQAEPGERADRIAAELAPLTRAADTVSAEYINASDQHSAALRPTNTDLLAVENAGRAFLALTGQLTEAAQRLAQFRARHADLAQRLAAVQARVAPATRSALEALERARSAARAARDAGIVSAQLDADAARAVELGRVVQGGAFRAGAQAALDAAAQLTEAADAVTHTATRLVEIKDSSSGRLASARTRLAGIEGRAEGVGTTLSYLRRTYSLACSADLDHVPDRVASEVASARTLLEQIPARSQAGDWDAAAALMEQARSHLQNADDALKSVTTRRRDLDALAADPAAELDKVRFAVRDAQRLVVSAGAAAPSNEARILDGLHERLDAAASRLGGTHPDYWGYLVELRAVREVVAGVVRRTRAAIAEA